MGLPIVTMPIAFGAGFLSFFSPCILPMIPIYIMYLTGTTAVESNRKMAFIRTLGFVLGFTIVFMIMGLSASLLGKLFASNRMLLLKMSGIVMIFFGLNMMGIIKIALPQKKQKNHEPKEIKGFFSALVMGLAFATGWTPCFGPVLASIVFYAGATTTAFKGMLMLLVYALGMAIPFLLTALFITQFEKLLIRFEKFSKYMPFVSGIILILFGFLILFNRLTFLNTLFF